MVPKKTVIHPFAQGVISFVTAFAALIPAIVIAGLPVKTEAAYGDTSTFVSKLFPATTDPNAIYLDFPEGMVGDGAGRFYIADTQNNMIRLLDTKADKVSVIAGNGDYGFGDGFKSAATFARPYDIARDSGGNLYIADTENHAIRKITSTKVSTLISRGLSQPKGVSVIGLRLYLADTGNGLIKSIKLDGSDLRIHVSGLSEPTKLLPYGTNTLFVTEKGKQRILKVNLLTGTTSVFAGGGSGNGIGTSAGFSSLFGMAIAGNTLYVAETVGTGIDTIRAIDLGTREVTTFFKERLGLTLRRVRDLEFYGNRLYALSTESRINSFLLSDPVGDNRLDAVSDFFNDRTGPKANTLVGRPYDLALTKDRTVLYMAVNNKIRKINFVSGTTNHVIGRSVDNYIEGTDADFVAFSAITSIVLSADEARLYVVDHWNNRIRTIDLATKTASLLAGGGEINCMKSCNGYAEGKRGSARFNTPTALVLSPDGKTLYVSDTGNNRIRQVNIATGQTSLIAGSGAAGYADGIGATAKFNHPIGVAVSKDGKTLYVADQFNDRIRKINLDTKAVTTFAGSGTRGYRDGIGLTAVFSLPANLEMGGDGNLYLSDTGAHRLRFINTTTGSVRTITGSGTRGFQNGTRFTARFNDPKGLAVDNTGGKLYIADYFNDLIRRVDIPGDAPFFQIGPTVTGIEPLNRYRVGGRETDTKYVRVKGTNFRHGDVVQFGDQRAIATYVNNSTELSVLIPFGKLAPNYYDVTVTSLDGQSGTLKDGFVVLNVDGSLPPENTPPAAASASFLGYKDVKGDFTIASGNSIGDIKDEIVQGTGAGLGPQIRVFDIEGKLFSSFFAFAETLRSGVRVASCDLNNNRKDEFVVSAGPPGRPHIRILNDKGAMTVSPGFFALDGLFQGGTNVACGDINGDGKNEIMVAASQGGGPQVTVHKPDGTVMANFFAFDPSFRGGVNLAAADLNGDGKDEIITVPEKGTPQVRAFSVGKGVITPVLNLFAFQQSFGGGLSVAGGDIDGDGKDEIVVGQRTNGQAWVKVLDQKGLIRDEFLAYRGAYQGGVNVAIGDVDGDRKDEVLTIPSTKSLPEIKVFDVPVK